MKVPTSASPSMLKVPTGRGFLWALWNFAKVRWQLQYLHLPTSASCPGWRSWWRCRRLRTCSWPCRRPRTCARTCSPRGSPEARRRCGPGSSAGLGVVMSWTLNIIELSPATHIFNWLRQKFRKHFLFSFPFWLWYSFDVVGKTIDTRNKISDT